MRRSEALAFIPDGCRLTIDSPRAALAGNPRAGFNGAKGHSRWLLRTDNFAAPTLLAATLALVAALGASPARADRCDDTAKELKNQIDGLKVSVKTGNMIYLSHPAAKELSLGCRGRNYSNELYAKARPQAEAGILRSGRLRPAPSSSPCRSPTR